MPSTINNSCVFCNLPEPRVIAENETCISVRDGYPVSLGHTLIIAKRHVASFFELSLKEQTDLLSLLGSSKLQLEKEFKPDGYNVGINIAPVAGQTVQHVHVHLIPRYFGDVSDPRGGVRWVIPSKADYWS
jgi:diadenosine tetraphosphate (Ap4A) HIT family hydrolase